MGIWRELSCQEQSNRGLVLRGWQRKSLWSAVGRGQVCSREAPGGRASGLRTT